MLDKTSEKIDPSISDHVGELSAKMDDPATLPQATDMYDESDIGSDTAVPLPTSTAAGSPMLQATDQEYDESDTAPAGSEPALTDFPNDIAAESTVASTHSASNEFPEDIATDSVVASTSYPSSNGFPNDIAAESTVASTHSASNEFPEDIATDSVVTSTSYPSSNGFPNDIAAEPVVASTHSASNEFPNDIATDAAAKSTSWQPTTSESSTDPRIIFEETTTSIADAFFVHREEQLTVLPTSVAEAFFNKDNPNPTIPLPSIADDIFTQNPPNQSEQSQLAAPPPITFPPDAALGVAPVPSLLLQDVQSDADLSLLRVKYRERYIELEEMLEYAAATSKLDPLSLSLEVKKLKKVFFYESPAHLTVESLCEAEADMEELYATLSQLIYPATIQTLRATSELYPIKHSWWSSWLLGSNSIGLNFFRQIIWVAIALIALLCLKEGVNFYITDQAASQASAIPGSAQATVASIPKNPLELLNRLLQMATPFLYGAIGSLVYIYKTLSDLYVCRTLDPNKLANDWMRLFMGGLMGGLTVALFYQQYYSQGYVTPDGDINKISAVALAFLTGYSVEFFYRILDRIINTVLPKSVDDNMTQVVISPRQQQMDMLLKRLKDAKSDEDKAVIRGILGKL